jgi:hypothetical protein
MVTNEVMAIPNWLMAVSTTKIFVVIDDRLIKKVTSPSSVLLFLKTFPIRREMRFANQKPITKISAANIKFNPTFDRY